jgi:hypothetical protein
MSHVTESLAYPLAAQRFEQWVAASDRTVARASAGRAAFDGNTWKGRQQQARALERFCKGGALPSGLLTIPGGLLHVYVFVEAAAPGARLSANVASFHRRRPVNIDSDWFSRRLLPVSRHAGARLFQRLRTIDDAPVFDELRSALLLAFALRSAAEAVGHRQFWLPTASGGFRGDVEKDCLHASTWIAVPEEGRWKALDDALTQALQNWAAGTRASPLAAALGIDAEAQRLTEAIRSVLEPFDWLRGPYAKRDDPVGDLWAAAREAEADGPQ